MIGRARTVAAVTLALACSTAAVKHSVPTPATPARNGAGASYRTVRIALAENQKQVRVTSATAWQIYGADGHSAVALSQPGENWLLEPEGRGIRAMREDSRPVSAREPVVVIRPLEEGGSIGVNGKRWHGEILVSVTNEGLLVVNRLPMDDYLRGVVPLEIGTTAMADVPAVEAQAIAARSYAITHLDAGRQFDMRATVIDQIYGGIAAETQVANVAIEQTSGLVLMYNGQAINAPYHATCGGFTAEPQDVWRANGEPYLRRVSDQIPGTGRFYCDAAPRYRWTRTFARDELRQSVVRYLKSINAPAASLNSITDVAVTAVTPAGRVQVLTIETDRGRVALRGNEMRSALRGQGADLLYSTYFSADVSKNGREVESLVLHGGGNGHGVGMCQAGAIGRARAGQDFRTILQTYYPGTTVGTL